MPALPPDLADAAKAARVTITDIVHQSDKTLLAKGIRGGHQVAVKGLLDADPFWVMKWNHEASIYRAFSASPPPVRVPRLLYDDTAHLMVLEWLDGHRLAEARYPEQPIARSEVDPAIWAVVTLNAWYPPAGPFTTVFDYPERLQRYYRNGYLTDADYTAVTKLLKRTGGPSQVNHGDPVASNILISDRDAALLDWEFCGLFLPGFDLAMLHTQLGAHTPDVKDIIDDIVTDAGYETPFLINLIVVLTRELRIHNELPAGPDRDDALAVIDDAWKHARDRLHQHARRLR